MRRILIVDDSRTFQTIIEKMLTPYFTIVGKGSSGIEGFDLYQKLKPDVVLMDITMPNCDGKECLQKILEFDSACQVVMLSGINDEKTIQECLNLGAKAFVNKGDLSLAAPERSPLLKTLNEILSYSSLQKVA
jgi:two-component system, chemotaxis family, chemotaxis protein CheY